MEHELISTPLFQPKIRVVQDNLLACPGCGAYWGHPNPDLDFPNRYKVDDFCRCYNPNCNIGYYNPDTGETELEPSPDERAKIQADVADFMNNLDSIRVRTYNADGTITDSVTNLRD